MTIEFPVSELRIRPHDAESDHDAITRELVTGFLFGITTASLIIGGGCSVGYWLYGRKSDARRPDWLMGSRSEHRACRECENSEQEATGSLSERGWRHEKTTVCPKKKNGSSRASCPTLQQNPSPPSLRRCLSLSDDGIIIDMPR